MRPSAPLFDALAGEYDEHFAVPHRAAYDELAWERLEAVLPKEPGLVVDAGCGVGRWAERLIAMGHSVIGIEPAPAMAQAARERSLGDRFTLIEGRMEDVELEAQADVVMAMGSLQYTRDPEAAIARLASWTRPGGTVLVLVDSLVALALELLRAGKQEEAMERLRTHQGVWQTDGQSADLHLLHRERLETAFTAAGLEEIRSHGLLVGASVDGRDQLTGSFEEDPEARLATERELTTFPLLADLGKQLLVEGHAPPGVSL
jgi:SAM-dependent methyltransferase